MPKVDFAYTFVYMKSIFKNSKVDFAYTFPRFDSGFQPYSTLFASFGMLSVIKSIYSIEYNLCYYTLRVYSLLLYSEYNSLLLYSEYNLCYYTLFSEMKTLSILLGRARQQ